MNKQELISAVAIKGEMSKKSAEQAIDAVFNVIKDAVVDGDKVQIVNFGAFEKKATKGAEGTIQFGERKGQKWTSEDSFRVGFKAGKGFSDAVKGIAVE